MRFFTLILLPALVTAIDYATCDGDNDKFCVYDTDCTTSGFTGAACTDANGPATTGPGCCTGGSADASTTEETTTTIATRVVTVAAVTCVDKVNPLTGVSDCPARSSLCANTVYTDVMRDQCPRTCGFCSNSGGKTTSTCTDLVNPMTNISDCPGMKIFCTNPIYESLMRVQCPATCGFC